MSNKHERKTTIPYNIECFKEFGIISWTDLSSCSDLLQAAIIMISVLNQCKKVVQKVGEQKPSSTLEIHLQNFEIKQ
jgi:hypothetical protein